MNKSYDAIIIGGGPAGASAGAILADHGRRVLILERERFPRYHIGESLIPFTFGPLERLGLIPAMKSSCFTKKYSVSFVQPDGKRSQPFYFFTRYDKETVAQTWQVTRAEFDQMLLDHARKKGVEVREGSRVEALCRENGRVVGVEYVDEDGNRHVVNAKMTLDASGKEAFASNKEGWRVKDPWLNKIAVWTYYRGSKRESGIDEGATTIAFVPEKGWFWHIPLQDDRVSVGVVAEGRYLTRDGVKDPKAIFDREVGQNLWIQEHLAQGKGEGEYWVTSEYSRHSRYGSAPGLLLLGDAFAFLDPVFSSGVMLALKSGVLGGDAVNAALDAPDEGIAAYTEYGRVMREGVENMRKLVYAFYNPAFSFRDVIERYPEAGDLITDCLSGDLNRDYKQLWAWINEFAELPETLPYGMPQQV